MCHSKQIYQQLLLKTHSMSNTTLNKQTFRLNFQVNREMLNCYVTFKRQTVPLLSLTHKTNRTS